MDVEREIDKLDGRLRRLEDIEIRSRLEDIRADLDELKRGFERRREERERERVASVQEKKADRRWQIATAFTTATFVLGAFALILQAFGGA